MRCQEKQKQKLVDMIKFALNEVGCEELPSGCDDHLDPNFDHGFNNDNHQVCVLILERFLMGAGFFWFKFKIVLIICLVRG